MEELEMEKILKPENQIDEKHYFDMINGVEPTEKKAPIVEVKKI